MADQKQAQSDNVNQTELNDTSIMKSTNKESKNESAAAITPTATSQTGVPGDNSANITDNNVKGKKKSFLFLECFLFFQIRSLDSEQIVLDGQTTGININDIALESDEEAASKKEWRFWRTQPVTPFGIKVTRGNNGPIEENKHIEQLKQEPYKLPDGFSWDEINVLRDEEVKQNILKNMFIEFRLLVKRIVYISK